MSLPRAASARASHACALKMGDSGRPTYEGLKQKVQEKDKQLEEALAIIKELTEALQGVRTRSALPALRIFA